LARQKESDTATFNYIDNLSRAIRHAGRILVDMIPKVYDTPRIIRVIHEDGDNESVAVNQPFTPPAQEHQAKKQTEEIQGLTKIYDLTTGKYDVTCEVGPSYSTKREEAANQMLAMIQAFPQLFQVAGDLLATNLDWPGADDISERLKLMLPPQIQGANPQVQQLQQQMQQMDGHARQAVQTLNQQIQGLQGQLQVAKTQSESDGIRNQIDAAKLELDKFKAETERIRLISEIQQTQIQPAQAGFSLPA